MQPAFATNMDYYPSMAAHCHYVPPNIALSESPVYMQTESPKNVSAVSFERKHVAKRGRDEEEVGERCTYYRNSVASISPKRNKAVESQV
ncbi:hypothetical protein IWW50_002505 [Coemansia erecta]|nr:hypothetical protein GGF43_002540 [Coemansia sp. RSA 2618]KAJ2826166.1 hypothetical protein IWW50_002505 [Coemansia erecta]